MTKIYQLRYTKVNKLKGLVKLLKRIKSILLEQAKDLAVQLLEVAGHALLKTANDLRTKLVPLEVY